MAEIKDSKLIRDALGSPVPQYWDETSQMYIARTVDGSFADVDFSKVRLSRDKLGSPIPQLWDVETARFVPSKGSGNGEVTIGSVTGLQAKLDTTTATLAETVKKTETGVLDLNVFDEPSRNVLQGQAPGTINAVLGPGNVQIENLAFVQNGINLVNPLKAKSGIVISSAGAETANASYTSTEKIRVEPSSVYSLRNVNYVSSYTAEGVFISRFAVPADQLASHTLTTLSTAGFVVLSINTNTYPISTVMLNKGAAVPFESYRDPKLVGVGADIGEQVVGSRELANDAVKPEKIASGAVTATKIANQAVSLDKTDFIEKTSNLFNPLTSVKGYTMDLATGELIANAMYDTSDFIKVTPNTNISLKGFIRVVNFNAAKQRIAGGANYSGTQLYDGVTRLNNATTEYIRVVYVNDPTSVSYVEEKQINAGTSLLPYEKYSYKFKETLNLGMNKEAEEVGSKFILDTDIVGVYNVSKTFTDYTSFWQTIPSNDVYAMFDALQAAYPEYITKQVLTNEYTGLPIAAYHCKPARPVAHTKKKLPKVFITCGTHGYEHATTLNMYLLLKEMCESWNQSELMEVLRFNIDLIIIPIVNPYGWNNYIRRNSRDVDINRQFPTDWVPGLPTDNTYGGTAPLTEIEALNIKQIFDENKDIDIYYDYHNFGNPPDNSFIWLAASSGYTHQQVEPLIRKLERKWRQEFNFIPANEPLGYTSYMLEGTMHNYAYKTLGINLSGTFETCDNWKLDPNGVLFDQNTLKAGVETIANLLLFNLRELARS